LKAFIIKTDTVITPFNEHPGSLLILNQELKAHQEQILRKLNIDFHFVQDASQMDSSSENIVFYDYTYVSENLLKEFISESRKIGKATVCGLKKGAVTSRTVVRTMSVNEEDDHVTYNLFYYPPGSDDEKLHRVIINPDEYVVKMPFPKHMVKEEKYAIPVTTKLLAQIEHWANLWACNIGAVFGYVQEFRNSPKMKLLGMALKARSTNPWKVSARNVSIGNGCDIHPTAYLENTSIGDNVEVGACTVIRGCKIGNNTLIANNSNISYSVIGDGCNIMNGDCVQYSVLYPGTFVACKSLNCCFMGKDTFIGGGATLSDFRFDEKNILVLSKGRKIDTDCRFLGSCVGHRSYIGAGVLVSPGREIPNDVKIMPSENSILTKVPAKGDFTILSTTSSTFSHDRKD
jgi:carbonic anhydrase/acetyltransferase-like protein (isoleucine patch superfamily)